jgi:DNA-binding response OmpR family regulator
VGTLSPTVLVLDDDPGIRDSMERLLRAYGYSPLTAANLDEASRVIGEARVDALILDVRLGDGTTGLDLLHTIRDRSELAEAPILILTGAVLSDAEEALITRMRAYLFQKPEGFHTLLQFLDTLTGRGHEH